MWITSGPPALSVRPFVSTLYLLKRLTWVFLSVWATSDPSSSGIENQGHRSRVYGLNISWRPQQYILLSRHHLRASMERRAAWHGRCQRQWWSPARVGVVTRSVWPRSSIKDSCSSVEQQTFGGSFSPVQLVVDEAVVPPSSNDARRHCACNGRSQWTVSGQSTSCRRTRRCNHTPYMILHTKCHTHL